MDKRWGIVPSLLLFVPLFALTATYSAIKHYALPIPIGPVARDDLRPSEFHILAVAQHLSETIGYRTVGTKEHADGDAWMHQQVLFLKNECDRIASSSGRHLECEVWRQEGSGHHRFDIMGYRLYKAYVGLTNIIVRVSNGTAAGKEHAILANSHIDSTPPSPGAADDALAVGVMLECIRVLIHDNDWDPTHAIIFLFNNAEESLQDGSHLYSTQHPTAQTVRAVINLEAAGTKGPELLFQATSDEMIQAYASVPRPYGTILANDVFSSGIILSDTDFRQFEEYLGVPGLDMAVVGHSYFYHTQKDTVEYIDPGVAQHMADNTLALLRYFTVPSSPLPSLAISSHSSPSHSTSTSDLAADSTTPPPKPKPHTVYLSLLGTYFITLPFPLASALYTSFLGACIALMWETRGTSKGSGGGTGGVGGIARGMLHMIMSLLSSVVCANIVAALMHILGRGMSWFSREWLPLVLYGPPAMLGSLLPSILPLPHLSSPHAEYNTLAGTLLTQALLAAVLQTAFEVGSAVVFFLTAVPLFVALAVEGGGGEGGHRAKVGGDGTGGNEGEAKEGVEKEEGHSGVNLRTYVIAGLVPVLVGTEVWCGVADVFVPLTGRMGEKAPAEHIIATLTAFIVSYTLPLLPAFSLRFLTRPSPSSASASHTSASDTSPTPLPIPPFRRSTSSLLSTSYLLCALTALIMGMMALRTPYDAMHPRRMFVVHCENVTTGSTHLNFAGADSAPGLRTLVEGLARRFGEHGQGRGEEYDVGIVEMDDWNGDWDTLYPFSAFLTPYKIRLPHVDHSSHYRDTFRVTAENDSVDLERGTRSLTLKVVHPGVIWTVIAFDAHVLQWSLDAHPPPYFARHHVKEASFYGIDTWSLDLVIRLPSNTTSPSPSSTPTQNATGTSPFPLKVNFVGTKETVQFPAKRGKEGGAELRLLEEMHEWLDKTTGGAVDALLFGAVGGVVVL